MDVNDISEQTYISIPKNEYVRLKELEKEDHDFYAKVKEIKDDYEERLKSFKLRGNIMLKQRFSHSKSEAGLIHTEDEYILNFNGNEEEAASFIKDKIGFKSFSFEYKHNDSFLKIDNKTYIEVDHEFVDIKTLKLILRSQIEDIKLEKLKLEKKVEDIKMSSNLWSLIKKWYSLRK